MNFKDKSGKDIHVDDIVQHQLGKFGKSRNNGPIKYRVIIVGNTYRLIAESNTDKYNVGFTLNDKISKNLIVIDCRH